MPENADIVRPGIVHRLDRGTSGIMVVAKRDAAHSALAEQFAKHTSHRTYLALVWGVPVPSQGTITGAIARDPADRLRMTVVPDGKGKPAITHYSVLESLDAGHVALVRFQLETGRTHQVRVHSRHLGHPLLGDVVYKGAQLLRGPQTHSRVEAFRWLFEDVLTRPALHAATLAFNHPASSERLSFTSELPDDMQRSIAALRTMQASADCDTQGG